ncbi:HAMP domain-containing sensor histidine kinase [Granulicella mallensis]|uniref:histidine kinase n=1 Tax=Granulicella mallensis TaxID=940614 RepID=A0A7W7ZNA1_9BACT|nr:ATP-binding protein [Granulicella mallensis]MBB5062833.1 signal transduction histidine kinase [Granulicella mallensis]
MKILASSPIRTRLTVWYVALLAAILAIYISVVFIFQYGLLEHQMFHDEVQDVETVEGLLFFDAQGQLHLQQDYYSHPRSHLLVDRLMEVRDLSGVVLYRTDTLNGLSLGGPSRPNEGGNGFDERAIKLVDGTHVLVISHLHPVGGRQVLIRLGYSLVPLRDRMFQFFLLLLVAMPIGLVIAGFAGYSIAKRAFLPLDLMAARAEQITASNLQERVVVENEHDELGHMARVLNHLLQRLEQAFAQLQRFTADAAHELRTPLASLRAAGEIALQETEDEEGYREAISSMLEETVRLDQTIDGLLMLSRAEAAQLEAMDEFLLPDLVNEILVLLEVVTDEKQMIVEQEQDEHARQVIFADRSLVRVALLNVLHNAVKFSGVGSTLRIRYSQVHASAVEMERVCIHDSGPGISAGEHQRVFERFFSGKSKKVSPNSGAGLGLSIARLAVERNGGKIFFDEGVASGARCCVDLPIMRSAKRSGV